jgi:ribonuclease HI
MSRDDAAFVAIYADEACIGNGREGSNPGGAGGLVEHRGPSGAIVRRDYWVSDPATTNNRMALRSVIEAFRALRATERQLEVVFTSDSKYLISGFTEWVFGWARRGWRRSGGPIENLELWWEAIRAVGDSRVAWRWVRGHDGHPQNEYADQLATSAARRQTRSDGLVPSRFDTWLSTRADSGVPVAAFPFPSRETFRANPRLPAPPDADLGLFA